MFTVLNTSLSTAISLVVSGKKSEEASWRLSSWSLSWAWWHCFGILRPAFLRILFKSGAWRNSKDRLLLQTLVQIAWAEIPSCKVTNQSNPKHLQITGALSCFSCGREAFYLFMRHMSNKCIPRLFTKKCTNESRKSSTVSKYNLNNTFLLLSFLTIFFFRDDEI